MRFSRLPVATATAVLIGVTGGTLGTAATAHAATPGTLPFAHYSDMVADGPHGHLFISGGLGTGSLVVTDFDGAAVGSVTGEPNATALALSPDDATLYVALPGNNAISAVDTATLTEKARYSTGTADEPSYLAFTGGKLWFGYGGETQGGIGSIDVGAEQPVVTLTPGTWYSAPRLAADPAAPHTLVAGDPATEPAEVRVYDVSSGKPVVTADRRTDGAQIRDMAITPDGKDLVVASGAPYYHQVYTLAALTPDGRYGTNTYPNAVAIAPDGTVAAGIDDSLANEPDVYLFAQGAGEPAGTFDLAPGILADAGLVWDPDGSRLFAITMALDGSSPVLQVLTDQQKAASRLAVTYPVLGVPGQPLRVSGTLTSGTPFAAGQVVHVTRTDPAHPDGVSATVPVAADGSFSFADLPTTEGTSFYTVAYAGDADHAGTATSATVPVAKAATVLVVSAPAAAKRGSPVKLTVSLASALVPVPANTVVHVTKKDASGTTALPDRHLAADGTVAFTDTPQIGGTDTYTVSYPGDVSHTASSASAQVQVSRAATAVSVTTNAATYGYGGAAKVTAHLGTTFNGRTVSLWATPFHGTKTLVKTGKVDSHGNLAAGYTVTRGTTFTVSFAGDYRYAPASAAHGVRSYARVTEGQRGFYTSLKSGSVTYRVYHHTVNPALGAVIAPAKHGECVAFTAQAYVSGAWRSVATASCIRTDAGSAAWATLQGTHAVGYKYRFRTEYVHSAADPANLNTYGSWQYFTFRK